MDSPRNITPNPPRWQPNPDPVSINVPGLERTAPVLDQIEQIEQLITIKLQNIDENFAKIHNLLANKLLPAVKRYAVGTEPVREAAEFWTSFYERAAQVRIPAYDDYSSHHATTPSTTPSATPSTTTFSATTPSTTPSTTTRHTPHSFDDFSSQHEIFAPGPSTTIHHTPRSHYSFAIHNPDKSSLWMANESLDDSFDGLPAGMSPPVLMSPAPPPRSAAELGLGKTPTRLAAERITQDLISDIQRKSGGGLLGRYAGYAGTGRAESTMSTVPTPPSLSRYTRQFSQEDPDSDSNSDSLDEVHNTAHPSAAFLMASQGLQGSSDDSFGSSNHSSDSLGEEDVVDGLGPVHPFARGGTQDHEGDGSDEDTFDDDLYEEDRPQEETLFGVPPAQRLQARVPEAEFRVLGKDLIQDALGVGEQMVRNGIEESPTPAGPFRDGTKWAIP